MTELPNIATPKIGASQRPTWRPCPWGRLGVLRTNLSAHLQIYVVIYVEGHP